MDDRGGAERQALSTYMGHANISITFDRYGHLMPGNEGQETERLDKYLAGAMNGVTAAATSGA